MWQSKEGECGAYGEGQNSGSSLARSIGNKLKYATIKSLNCEFVFVLPSLPAREAANSAFKR